MHQDKVDIIDELDTLKECHEVLIELVGEAPNGICSTKKLAVLIGYLHGKQAELINLVLDS